MRDAHNQQKAYEGVWANTGASVEDTEVAGRTVSLGSLFDLYGVPECVDMVDIDVQASEYEFALGHKGIFHGDTALDLLSRRARRVHIGLPLRTLMVTTRTPSLRYRILIEPTLLYSGASAAIPRT